MINVILKFYGLGINESNQADILIYDKNNLVYECKTYNGYLQVTLKPYHYYIIKAIAHGEVLMRGIITNATQYILAFSNALIPNNTITFTLTDSYYNLPIEKGFVILWPR